MILRRLTNRYDGFTIIELLIATTVFSVILLGATTALFALERMYYRGIVTNQTQTTSRQIMASISQQLQLSQNHVTISGVKHYAGVAADFRAFCIGTTRYNFILNGQVDDDVATGQYTANHKINHGLWRDTIPSSQIDTCTPLNLSLSNPEDSSQYADPSVVGLAGTGTELLAQNMRLASLSLNAKCISHNLCTIKVKVIYGDDDLLALDPSGYPIGCKTTFGDQWCATSGLQTQVFKRLQQNEGP